MRSRSLDSKRRKLRSLAFSWPFRRLELVTLRPRDVRVVVAPPHPLVSSLCELESVISGSNSCTCYTMKNVSIQRIRVVSFHGTSKQTNTQTNKQNKPVALFLRFALDELSLFLLRWSIFGFRWHSCIQIERWPPIGQYLRQIDFDDGLLIDLVAHHSILNAFCLDFSVSSRALTHAPEFSALFILWSMYFLFQFRFCLNA